MNTFSSALYTEGLKAIRSKVPLFTTLGFLIAPFIGGLFMIILKDPEAAKSMGLIGTKAQLAAGTADWPTFLNFLAQAEAIGGAPTQRDGEGNADDECQADEDEVIQSET